LPSSVVNELVFCTCFPHKPFSVRTNYCSYTSLLGKTGGKEEGDDEMQGEEDAEGDKEEESEDEDEDEDEELD